MARILIACLATGLLAGSAAAQKLEVSETDDVITVKQAGKLVLAYNKKSPAAPAGIDPVYQRSGCLHPVQSPGGKTVTAMFPADHPHQHGVFSAWVNTHYDGRKVDFWNLAGGTGRVLHERVVGKFQTDKAVGFEVDLIHRATAEPAVDVLRERWKITVHPTDGSHHCFDLQTSQTAIADKPLQVNKHHYGGVVFRGPMRWLTEQDRDDGTPGDLVREPTGFLNDHGSNRRAGNHQRARWVALWGTVEGKPVTIAVLCHADNFRAPQSARLHPSKPYFCFAPCVDGAFTIDRDNPFTGRYRFLIIDTRPNPAWIQQQWEAWCGK